MKELQSVLRGMQDDDYVALASKGLLRRARKEIEQVQLQRVENGIARLSVGDRSVTLPPAGPAQATCDCPAPGVCQHIIAACIHLADTFEGSSEATEETVSAGNPWWLDIEPTALRKWSGVEVWRFALRMRSEVQPGDAVSGTSIVRFQDAVEVRLLPASNLEGVITTAPPRYAKRYIAAAILAQLEPASLPDVLATEGNAQVPLDLLHDIRAQLEACVRDGLAHLPAAHSAFFSALSTQCRAAGLYRPSRELEACAQEVRSIHQREAQADTERFLQRIVRLFALNEALRTNPNSPPLEFTGSARSTYQESATVELVGLGAYPWETASGFHGVTVLFWNPPTAKTMSWSDSRPQNSGDGFSPRDRFEGEGPWANSGSLEFASVSRITLEQPRINPQRRISGSGGTRAMSHVPVTPTDLPQAIESWNDWRKQVAERPTLGLRQAIPLDAVAHFRPHKVEAPRFDEISQSLVWPLLDAEGETLEVVLPFLPVHANAIQWLEKHWSTKDLSLIASYQRTPREHLFPVSVVQSSPDFWITSIGFAEIIEKKANWYQRLLQRRKQANWQPVSPILEDSESTLLVGPRGKLLSPLHTALLHAAESGLATAPSPIDWEPRLDQLSAAGLIPLSRSLRNAFADPTAFLTAVYVLSLHLDGGG